ncbi:MAG: AtpZ/AtpI family protein [Frankia sp.]
MSPRRPYRPGDASEQAWNTMGTMIAGLAFWGLVGYGIDRLAGTGHIFLPIGLFLGLGASLYLVIHRAGGR